MSTASSEQLWEILNHPETAANVQHMFTIGAEQFHESAFAVYQQAGHIAVSELLEPEIDATDLMDPNTIYQHSIIDVASITHILVPDTRYFYDVSEVEDAPLGTSARLTVKKIQNNKALSEVDKLEFIQVIIDRDLKQTRGEIYTPRTDLLFRAHNHPQSPLRRTSIGNLLVPSAMDLTGYVELQQVNPNLVDAIVASDGNNHGMMLVANDETAAGQDVYTYENTMMATDNAKRMREALAAAGFKSAILCLEDSGQPAPDQLDVVNSFTCRV